jgi:dTMP kinase
MESPMTDKGSLFVFEGPDGVGKSTIVQDTLLILRSLNINCESLAFPGRRTGTLGHHIYNLHHDPERFDILSLNPKSLQLLHVAAHIDTIEQQIRPLLTEGVHILLDRYWWSTWVYGKVSGITSSFLNEMIEVEKRVWKNFEPDIIFLIDRHNSFRVHENNQVWQKLRLTYYELKKKESNLNNIQLLTNDKTLHLIVESASNAISTHLGLKGNIVQQNREESVESREPNTSQLYKQLRMFGI